MNKERGIRRIILLVSIIVGLGVGFFLCFVVWGELDYGNQYYYEQDENFSNIMSFWFIWKEDGWDKKNVMKYLLTKDKWNKTFHYPKQFEISGKTVYLSPSDVFPGINENYASLLLEDLEKKAEVACREAVEVAKKKRDNSKYTPMPLIILYCSISGLAGGAVSFVLVWLVYYILFYLLKWLALGFADNEATGNKESGKRL